MSAAGFSFDVEPAEVDERRLDGESVERYVVRLAIEKSREVAARHPAAVVIGADTVVVLGDAMLGKPTDAEEAAAMLAALAGRSHQVWTGVALTRDGRTVSAAERSTVRFGPLTSEEIAWYVATGEPRDKAGAYAVQGLASRFIESIEGSYSNVVGLPVFTVYRMLAELESGRPPAGNPAQLTT